MLFRSKSGMSRNIKFVEMVKSNTSDQHHLLNFYQLFEILGYTNVKNTDQFRIGGCGMDMGFHLVYSLGWSLYTREERQADPGYSLKQTWL